MIYVGLISNIQAAFWAAYIIKSMRADYLNVLKTPYPLPVREKTLRGRLRLLVLPDERHRSPDGEEHLEVAPC